MKFHFFYQVFDVLMKYFRNYSLIAYVKYDTVICHFIDKINNKTSKYTKNVNCDVNVGTKLKIPPPLHAVDLIMCNKD